MQHGCKADANSHAPQIGRAIKELEGSAQTAAEDAGATERELLTAAPTKTGQLLARLPHYAHRRQSRAHQIADRLMGRVWNPYR